MKKMCIIISVFWVLGITIGGQAETYAEIEKQTKIWADEFTNKFNDNDIEGAMEVLLEHPTLILGINEKGINLIRIKCQNGNVDACLEVLEWKKEYTPREEMDTVCMASFDLALNAAVAEKDKNKKENYHSVMDSAQKCITEPNQSQLMELRRTKYNELCNQQPPKKYNQSFQQFMIESPWTIEQYTVAVCLMQNNAEANPDQYKENLAFSAKLTGSLIEYFPEDTQALLISGYAHYLLNEYDTAQKRFSQLITIEPNNPMANHWYADIIVLQQNAPTNDQWQTALKHYTIARDNHKPEHLDYLVAKCNVMAIQVRVKDKQQPSLNEISACYAELETYIPELDTLVTLNETEIKTESFVQELKMLKKNLQSKPFSETRNKRVTTIGNEIDEHLIEREQVLQKTGLPNYGIYTSKGGDARWVVVAVRYH